MNESIPIRYIGEPVTRIEDGRLLTGRGQFIDDVALPDMVHMAILRSPQAHALINSIDVEAAKEMPGVIDAFSATDIEMALPEIPLRLAPFKGFERFLQKPIAVEKVRYVGEPFAVVIAEDRYLAEDALAAISFDLETLPAVTDVEQAETGDILLHDDAGENVGAAYDVGRGDIEAAFKAAAYVRRERFVTNRHAACPLETRGLIGECDPRSGVLRLTGAAKVTFFNRRHLATAFGLEENQVELIELDVGGGFGARGELYPEDYLVLIASQRVGRPVKWIEDRRENLMACNHSRDITCDLEIAATRDGKILGLRCEVRGDLGAYIRTNGGVVPSKAVQFMPGPYRVPAFASTMKAIVTNKTPVGTMRGPGRFEASFCRERMLDMMADDLDIDPAELRLRNLMAPDELPFRIGELIPGDANATFDDGDYASAFRQLLEAVDYEQWKDRQGTECDGKLMGLGLAIFIESSAAGPPETARITVGENGDIDIGTGASSVGQGLETGMAQICAEGLQTDIGRISVQHGSTTVMDTGGGTFHSRCTVMAGNAVRKAADALRDKALELAALRWNVSADSLTYESGGVTTAHGERLSLSEIAAFAATRENDALSAESSFSNDGKLSYSYGAHSALVAVDIETGDIELIKYAIIEEIGRALNPAMVNGQAVGGLVQGLGGTLLDHFIYDDDGQLMTTNFAEYLLPVATGLPEITAIALEESPSKFNPMGFKGAGEGGIVAVAGAVGNAVSKALRQYNVKITDLPLSPMRIRELLVEKGV
ncbi:MAG: carbon monoxide dehydrogenase [Rhodospirillaceae bacterium]|nr:carbon monoxide dehydrogenase [Rhodospirillaceae bacterium]|tara:strand:- start:5178 stop:7487 length:2310 start_codon:yes stop_codon:yes gene_type:complete